MMTAYEANKATKDRLDQVAKEFITNVVSEVVRESVEHGAFTATVEIIDPLAERAADNIVSLLRDEYRFKVELTPSVLNSNAYLELSWEVEEE